MCTYICVSCSDPRGHKLPMVKLQKLTSCRHCSLPRFRVYGTSIAGACFHVFDTPVNATALWEEILFRENLYNPNGKIRLFAKQIGKWDIMSETQVLKADRLVVPHIIIMKSTY